MEKIIIQERSNVATNICDRMTEREREKERKKEREREREELGEPGTASWKDGNCKGENH